MLDLPLEHLTVRAPDPHLCAGDGARRQPGSLDADAFDAIHSNLQGWFHLGIEGGGGLARKQQCANLEWHSARAPAARRNTLVKALMSFDPEE